MIDDSWEMTEDKKAALTSAVSQLMIPSDRYFVSALSLSSIRKNNKNKQCIDMHQVQALIFVNAISYHFSMAQSPMPGSFALSIKTKQRIITSKILLRIAKNNGVVFVSKG